MSKEYPMSAIAAKFAMEGRYVEAAPYGSGHINDTFAAVFDQNGKQVRYIIQRINHAIFKKPAELMRNIELVTGHTRRKLEESGTSDIERKTLTLVPGRDGLSCQRDENGNYWRAYIFIECARTYDVIESAEQAYEAARAYGRFQRLLADLPAAQVTETIPGFHDTPRRFRRFQEVLAVDVCGRAAEMGPEIAYALSWEKTVGRLLELAGQGTLPLRITHNDTKLNNVMLDDATGEGICVIDLDTIMPGLTLYDFGDMVRSATNSAREDEPDVSKVGMQIDMFEAIARGYLESTAGFLSEAEIAQLAFSGEVITFEIGLRFLTDYLEGDVYFKTHRPGQNRDRCRGQFTLARDMCAQHAALERIVKRAR